MSKTHSFPGKEIELATTVAYKILFCRHGFKLFLALSSKDNQDAHNLYHSVFGLVASTLATLEAFRTITVINLTFNYLLFRHCNSYNHGHFKSEHP